MVLFYGSGNRDDAVFDDPYTFDITRDNTNHIGFGALARLLSRRPSRPPPDQCALQGLLSQMPDIHAVGEPDRLRSSFINGVKHLSAPAGAPLDALRSSRAAPNSAAGASVRPMGMDRCLRLVAHTVDLDDDAFAPLAVADIVADLEPDRFGSGGGRRVGGGERRLDDIVGGNPDHHHRRCGRRDLAATTATVGATATAAITSRAQHAGAAGLVDQLDGISSRKRLGGLYWV